MGAASRLPAPVGALLTSPCFLSTLEQSREQSPPVSPETFQANSFAPNCGSMSHAGRGVEVPWLSWALRSR